MRTQVRRLRQAYWFVVRLRDDGRKSSKQVLGDVQVRVRTAEKQHVNGTFAHGTSRVHDVRIAFYEPFDGQPVGLEHGRPDRVVAIHELRLLFHLHVSRITLQPRCDEKTHARRSFHRPIASERDYSPSDITSIAGAKMRFFFPQKARMSILIFRLSRRKSQ